MDLLNSIWFVAIVAFAAGTGLGLLLFNLLQSDDVKSRKLESQLQEVEHDFEIYKQTVTSHFNTTSELVHNLTEDYVKVYKHLSEGAEKLADPQQLTQHLGQQQPNALLSAMGDAEETAADKNAPVEPPKDYAPPADDSATEDTAGSGPAPEVKTA